MARLPDSESEGVDRLIEVPMRGRPMARLPDSVVVTRMLRRGWL